MSDDPNMTESAAYVHSNNRIPVFKFTGAGGESARLVVWNGAKNFSKEFPTDIINLVGGNRIAVVQVGKPVGRYGRSSIALSDFLVGCGFHGIIHWARDTETYAVQGLNLH